MYPMLKEGVTIGTFRYEGSDTIHYYIENAAGEEFEINHSLWNALLQADGTRPLKLPDKGRRILPRLKRYNLIRTSRFVRDDGAFNRLILFPIGNRRRNGSRICRAINAALPASAVLIFLIGVSLMKSKGAAAGYQFGGWLNCDGLYYGLLVCSLALHEAGHLAAGIAYGYKISDTGILLLGIIPIGAYVAHEDKEDASSAEKLQFALAGIEVNLLIAGICLLAAMQYDPLPLVLVAVANVNVVLAGVNLLPAPGLDGESALSAVCGVNSISETAEKWLFSKKRRQKLLRSGVPGYACFCVFAIVMISRVLLWLLILFDAAAVCFKLF